MTRLRFAAVGAALLLAACGSSNPRSSSRSRSAASQPASTHTLCLPEVKALMATALSVDPTTITTATGVGTNGNPQCTFTAHTAHHQPNAGRCAARIASNASKTPATGITVSSKARIRMP